MPKHIQAHLTALNNIFAVLRRWLQIHRRWVLLIAAYMSLLALSHGIRLHQPDPFPAPPHLKSLVLPSAPQAENDAAPLTIRYLDLNDTKDSHRPVVLLIHGSPLPASRAFTALAPELATRFRVLAPDLPGFGYSSRRLDDYSFKFHAAVLRSFLDALDLARVHLVAYSMGGGAAIHLAAQHRKRVASLIMLSAVGVQELELLGEYHLNHALHGLQLGLLWLLQEATPHFGLLDCTAINTNYARNFFDSDQRPLRDMLQRIDQPVLIWHADQDQLVPAAAAKEHHRLLPQSRLQIESGGHLLLFQRSAEVALQIDAFIDQVLSGQAPSRSAATAERKAAAARPFANVRIEPAQGLLLLLYMALIALATLVSEDLACIGAGLMAARGIIGFVPAVCASFIGIVGGDLLLFLAGRYFGRAVVQRAPFKWMVTPEDIDRAARWFSAKGPIIIISSRFLPGSRLPTYLCAGLLGQRIGRFCLYFGVAALLWTPALVGLAMLVGHQFLNIYHLFQNYALIVAVGIIFGLWGAVRLVVPLFSFRGRRLLLAAWRRRWRWEFWPPYLFYLPIVVYVLLLGLRFRNPTLFTAVNPVMPAGGIKGESKSAILDHLRSSGRVPRYQVLDRSLTIDRQVALAAAFMARHNLDFPIICKPDVGERGKGVRKVRSQAALSAYLHSYRSQPVDIIVQRYVEGYEFGIFYYRYPGDAHGRIFSITDKRRLFINGDGVRTLETLILRDERAVCMAPLHFRVHGQSLFEVPQAGQRIELVEVGTHARGALFLDGRALITPALTSAIDAISRHIDGFYFGRYDIRVSSLEALRQGHDLHVLELNGVTSEATHVYDPRYHLLEAWRDLMQQWEIAFEIGASNVRRGVVPIRPGAFLALVLDRKPPLP
jgi:pimeloyl-ACP methyl ester carboxylesterase/membrane protein DedA with SNARE-associated domain